MSKKLIIALALAMSFGVSAAEIGYDGSHITDKESKRGFAPHENYDLVYADEFDGDELNLDEWKYRTGKRYPTGSQNYPENVSLKDDKLVIEYGYEDRVGDTNEATLTGGGVLSKKLFGYGYYEAKAKLFGETGGLHSSFWIFGQNGDNKTQPKNNGILEIDFYEVDSGKPYKVGTNTHFKVGEQVTMGGYTQDGKPVVHPEIDTSAQEFVMGVEWLPNQINWYLDGELFRTVKNPYLYGPQIMWITALASYNFDKEIIVDKLPGESYWEYFRFYNIDLVGVNMLANPSFEYNDQSDFKPEHKKDKKFPVGWYTKGKDMATAINVTMTNESYEGESILRHGAEKDYEVTTYIHVPFLPNETFTFTAMVRNPDGGNHTLTASGEGMAETSVAIPKTAPGVWQEVKLENIKVEKGEAVVGITSSAAAGQYLDIDSVSLVQVTGKPNHTSFEPFDMPTAEIALTDVVVSASLTDDRYKEVGGKFGSSGLPGYGKTRTRWAAAADGLYATWSPQLDGPGVYDIELFNVSHESRSENTTVEVVHADGVTKIPLNQKTTQGIVELGQFKLDENSYVKVSGAAGSGNLSFDTVIFKEEGNEKLKAALQDGVVLQVDHNEGLINGNYTKLDSANSNVRLKLIDGVYYVPIEFMARNFGGGDVTDEGQELTIFYQDEIMRYTQGSDVAKLGSETLQMDAKCFVEKGVWYAPATAMAEAFDATAVEVDGKYFILSKKEVPDIENMADRLAPLF
ncbi:family 16 glycosylhydrolase [Candidatus Epulonipiscium viviparus]|uniref:family 16 glycosylhydrolase n=1 Tax=Candidatus Epulonipiscium viviparus TaxID=420336 RepID=UPI00273807BB|nr:family 16 glycosylhydrolase [Candidatus Epulopiscium viviparus]